MSEVQKHGFDFEEWIKKTFFEQFQQTSYTDKWDAVNIGFKHEFMRYTTRLLGLPVSIKTCKYGSPIGFGDAIRQFQNTQDFLLFVGFWRKNGQDKKFVAAEAVRVSALEWHKLFDKAISPHELKKDQLGASGVEAKLHSLDTTIKSTFHYRTARKLAQEEKNEMPTMDVVLNPKIDSKNQRRLQCSLPFQIFWDTFARKSPAIQEKCTLWDEEVPLLK